MQICTFFCTLLSIGGSLCVFIFGRHVSDNKTYILVCNICAGTFTRSLGNLMLRPAEIPLLCIVQGFLKTFGGLYSFLWVLFTVFLLWSTVQCKNPIWIRCTHENKTIVSPKLLKTARIYITMIALVVAIFPLVDHNHDGGYQPLFAWCWISKGLYSGYVRKYSHDYHHKHKTTHKT